MDGNRAGTIYFKVTEATHWTEWGGEWPARHNYIEGIPNRLGAQSSVPGATVVRSVKGRDRYIYDHALTPPYR